MYESFFGLACEPFSVAPDPRFLYLSGKHQEALVHLNYGLRRGGGFVLLTGEIGAGKTTVWRAFLEQLPPDVDVAYVVNPKLGVHALLTRICQDLGVDQPRDGSVFDPVDALNGHLLLAHAGGRRTLIVVDEAQALAPEVLEQLRLLTNLVTGDRKLVQVLLIGQPELRAILEQPAMEPLAQRVVARFHLPALPESETGRYIAHRMGVAGWEGEIPFEAEAIKRIHRLCGGVPRRINVLCDRALLAAQARNMRRVDIASVDRAATEVFGRVRSAAAAPAPAAEAAAPQPARWLLPAAVGAMALGAGTLLAPLITNWGRAHAPATTVATAPAPAQPATAEAAPSPAPATPVTHTPAHAATTPPETAKPLPVSNTLPPPARLDSLAAAFESGHADEARAWHELATLWGTTLPPGDPCAVAARESLRCYRAHGGLVPIRQIDRPGIVKLVDDKGRVAHVLLTGIGEDSATVRLGGAERSVPMAALAQVWRGDFATFWRAPPGYGGSELVEANSPLAGWLGSSLAKADGGAVAGGAEALKARVFAFQLSRGLPPDGLVGPMTLMQLNRASGVEEPRLASMRR